MHRTFTGMNLASGTRRCAVFAALLCTGCAMPRHSNTLVFGTTTRFAIDVSQTPTSPMGITIGYKRDEAVWMPLMANEDNAGKLVPSKCKTDDCIKFQGVDDETGKGDRDAYSVLATFKGSASGESGGSGPKAGATLAQYFATGMAARLLAQAGGAALVNTLAEPASEGARSQAAAIMGVKREQVGAIGSKLSGNDGRIDAAALARLLTLSPAKTLSAADQSLIKAFQTRQDLENFLKAAPEGIADALFKTLAQL